MGLTQTMHHEAVRRVADEITTIPTASILNLGMLHKPAPEPHTPSVVVSSLLWSGRTNAIAKAHCFPAQMKKADLCACVEQQNQQKQNWNPCKANQHIASVK